MSTARRQVELLKPAGLPGPPVSLLWAIVLAETLARPAAQTLEARGDTPATLGGEPTPDKYMSTSIRSASNCA